jgi:glycosyltransferase involved in cell wall biosynthesis
VDGATLCITAPAPTDARPHERWVGGGSFAEGAALLDRSDVTVALSDDTPFTRAQLPAKVIDSMMAGRAVIASDLPPIRWALGDAGILVRPGSVSELAAALSRLMHDEVTGVAHLGERARRRALELFTPAAVAPDFAVAARAASDAHQESQRNAQYRKVHRR